MNHNNIDRKILSDKVSDIADHHLWLIGTQMDEIRNHRNRRKIVNEFVDIISISLQAIIQLGYEVPDAIWSRIGYDHKRRIKKIVGKYLDLYRAKIEQDMLERENGNQNYR